MTKREQAIALYEQGRCSYAEIARLVGTTRNQVWQWLGSQSDSAEWEAERKRHAEFFNGMTPKQEYDEHIKRRNAMEEKI